MTFDFDVVKVNAKGQEVEREKAEASYFSEDLGNGITLEMVAIPGGTFTMGTEDEEIERLVKKFYWGGYRCERPQHEVAVPPFFMGKYPITQA
ncbi:MAG: formylglycine-generating enzyme family protein, partial [Microcystis panniformis]